MEDLLKFGLHNKIFVPDDVLNLLYGNICHERAQIAKHAYTDLWKWEIVWYNSRKSWHDIPLANRIELLSLIFQKIKTSTDEDNKKDFDFFTLHIRILCLLHTLVNDPKNNIECIWNEEKNWTHPQKLYKTFFSSSYPLMQYAITEMFLWYQLGLSPSPEERRLLNLCWQKFLGSAKPRSPKTTKTLVEQKFKEKTKEYQKFRRLEINFNKLNTRYNNEIKKLKKSTLSSKEKQLLIYQLEQKIEVVNKQSIQFHTEANDLKTHLDFFKGYLEYINSKFPD